MTSMAMGYGVSSGWRKAVLALCCLIFMFAPASAGQKRLLVLGDSLTAGYGLARADGFQAQLQAVFPELVIIDGAVSGDTTAGGRERLEWALGDGADAALVELGGNDGLRGLDPRRTEENLAAILEALQARGVKVLLSGMYAPPNLGDAYQTEFRAVFDRLGARPGVRYDPFFLDGVAGDPALNQADRIHPNRAGVARVIARLTPILRAVLDEAGR